VRTIGLHPGADDGFAQDDFTDPHLQLIHLLTQAAGLEHSLMAAYLYAGFSLKPRYAGVRGTITDDSFGLHRLSSDLDADLARPHTLLDVAIEEMQHLGTVNRFLWALGAAPVLTPHQFPMTSDIYPFAVDLRPLTRPVAATFLWIEAESAKFGGGGPGSEPEEFQRAVEAELAQLPDPIDDEPVSHLGSLYHAIVATTRRLAEQDPSTHHRPVDWPGWLSRMDWILGQGELAHYHFFRDVFTGDAFGGGDVWADPAGAAYPSIDLLRGTAWAHAPGHIVSHEARELAWLGDIHYWLILGLLDQSYLGRSRVGRYLAVDQMTRCLWSIGIELAHTHRVGFPFDPLAPGYRFGHDPITTTAGLLRLAREAQQTEERLASDGRLPADYEPGALRGLIANLEQRQTASSGSEATSASS
jgi:hypothetical protein